MRLGIVGSAFEARETRPEGCGPHGGAARGAVALVAAGDVDEWARVVAGVFGMDAVLFASVCRD
ncbi:hypothetical protein GCM10010399_68810 [Dactylosporangium fulvum]